MIFFDFFEFNMDMHMDSMLVFEYPTPRNGFLTMTREYSTVPNASIVSPNDTNISAEGQFYS